jgi:hypothetical protein
MLTFILAVSIWSIKLGTNWFIYKDYYPLKERSPVLCIMLVLSICGQAVLYPIIYIVSYLTNWFESSREGFRALGGVLQFSIFTIYVMRCLRVFYAHRVHSSRNSTLVYLVFQKEYILAFSIIILGIIKCVIVVFYPKEF